MKRTEKQALYYTASSLPARTYGSLQLVDRGREDLGLVYRCFCTICRHHSKVDNCYATVLFWVIPEGQWWRIIFPVGTTLGSGPGCSLCLEGEMARHGIIYQFMDSGQWFGWMVRNLENVWKIVHKEIWARGMWRDLSKWAEQKNMKIVMSHAQQSRILIMKWIGWLAQWIPISLFPQPHRHCPMG